MDTRNLIRGNYIRNKVHCPLKYRCSIICKVEFEESIVDDYPKCVLLGKLLNQSE